MIFPLLWKCLERSWVYRLHHRLVSPDTFWARYATDFLKAKPGERVLDIGCGTADILDHLDRVDYTGIDYNPDYIAAARARYGNRGMFICAAVTPELAGIYQGFDLVIATGLLHHLNDVEADALFATARAALRPAGASSPSMAFLSKTKIRSSDGWCPGTGDGTCVRMRPILLWRDAIFPGLRVECCAALPASLGPTTSWIVRQKRTQSRNKRASKG